MERNRESVSFDENMPAAVVARYREATNSAMNGADARCVLFAFRSAGRRRARLSRRFGGRPLPPGHQVILHHRRADIALLTRGDRVVDVLLRGGHADDGR
jgi:hypothetical protein